MNNFIDLAYKNPNVTLYILSFISLISLLLAYKLPKQKGLVTFILFLISMIVVFSIIKINIFIGSDEYFSLHVDKTLLPILSLTSIILSILSPMLYFNRNHKDTRSYVRYVGDGRD